MCSKHEKVLLHRTAKFTGSYLGKCRLTLCHSQFSPLLACIAVAKYQHRINCTTIFGVFVGKAVSNTLVVQIVQPIREVFSCAMLFACEIGSVVKWYLTTGFEAERTVPSY